MCAARLPSELGARNLFHSNLFSGRGYDSALGNNRCSLQWVSHFGQDQRLPGGASPDEELFAAYEEKDVAAFKARARMMTEAPAVKGWSFMFLEMRKGDVVMCHSPRWQARKEYMLGLLPSEPWDEGAIVRHSLIDLDVDFGHGLDVDSIDSDKTLRAFRRVEWLMVGDIARLSDETKSYLKGFFTSTCQMAIKERGPDIYAACWLTRAQSSRRSRGRNRYRNCTGGLFPRSGGCASRPRSGGGSKPGS